MNATIVVELQLLNPTILDCLLFNVGGVPGSGHAESTLSTLSGSSSTVTSVRKVHVFVLPVLETEELAGLYFVERFGMTIPLKPNQILVLFTRRAIFKRNFGFSTIDQCIG